MAYEYFRWKFRVQREIWLGIDLPLDDGIIIPLFTELISDEFYLNYTANVTVRACPSLSIQKADSPDPVYEGENLSYTIIISNNGNMNASNVIIEDDYDESMLNITDADGGTDDGDKITWNIGNLTAGESKEYTVIAKVKGIEEETTFLNYATVTCGQSVSDSCSEQTTAKPLLSPPVLRVSLSSASQVETNSEIVYNIMISNIGEENAINMSITDYYDYNQIVVIDSDGGTDDGNKITWNVGLLQGGESINYTIVAKVIAESGSIMNYVEVSCENGNEDTNETTTVITDQPPVTELQFQGYANTKTYWGCYTLHYIHTGTTIKIHAEDMPSENPSGINHTYYRVWRWDDAKSKWKLLFNWKEYENEKIKLSQIGETNGYSAYGKYTIDFYSIDKSGNRESANWEDIYVTNDQNQNQNSVAGMTAMDNSIQGFELLLLLGAVAVVLLLKRKRDFE
ncbi:MAG: hypothetical protein U9O96_07020 [Candidatus Thermoplasmatota archaeon]|nr:hypothetical protein [Candidatus Thermoplasmatota archaeon]